jgi:hypothetical protein
LFVYEVLQNVGDVGGGGEGRSDFAEVVDRGCRIGLCHFQSTVGNARARYGLDGCHDEDGGRGGNDLDHGDGDVA